MSCVDLEVPYHEKDLAKALGARWDAKRKVWYAPEGANPVSFRRWLPQPGRITHRSSCYVILESRRTCWKCSRATPVFGFALPSGYESLEAPDADGEVESETDYESALLGLADFEWLRHEEAAVLMYIEHVSAEALALITGKTACYWRDFSAVTGTFYLMNHCANCDAKLGDFDTIDEFDAPLRPFNPERAPDLRLSVRFHPLEARASSGPWHGLLSA